MPSPATRPHRALRRARRSGPGRRPPCAGLLPLAAALLAAPAAAHDGHIPQRIEIEASYDNAVGTSDAASQGVVRAAALRNRPTLRPGEVLELVPGVVVTQHSGDGKANQYFLRGFNLDHGTDFATTLDGVPVNMPSHAHGQGYADLNPLLAEFIDRIEYRKGPYFARNGDFSAAGSADIHYKRRLAQPFGVLTQGAHAYRRAVLGGSTGLGGGTLLAGLEAQRHDGPWTVPMGHRKANGLLSWATGDAAGGGSLRLSAYDAAWRATDQVPQRALDDGRLGRWDAVDASDGGSSRRLALAGEWHGHTADGSWRVEAWALRYRVQLFSNFTYALERPVEGDQFEQSERRSAAGGSAARDWSHALAGFPARTEVGLQWRVDHTRLGLYDTAQRVRSATTREDRVRQHKVAVYAESAVEWTPWLRSVAGLRLDGHRFGVDAGLDANDGRVRDTHVSPKLTLVAGPWAATEFFLNAGRGFHSNDARGTTTTVDPRSGDPATPVPGLVSVRGWELGLRSEAVRGLQSSLALWALDSDSELVYVGDAGSTEPNRPSRRSGLEWNNRWQPAPWLLLDADLAWSRARFTATAPEGDRIPGAVGRVAAVAATVRPAAGWSGTLQWRHLGPRVLVEDGSVRAPSTLLTNLRVLRSLGPDAEIGLDVFNLLDRRLNDIEYVYESRLPGEAGPVTDRHVHPAEPRTLRLTLQVRL